MGPRALSLRGGDAGPGLGAGSLTLMQGARVGVKLTPQGDQSVRAALFRGSDSPGLEKHIFLSRPTPQGLSTASALPCNVHGKENTPPTGFLTQ